MQRPINYLVAASAFIIVSALGLVVQTQSTPATTLTNDAPNPFQTVENFFKLPEGRTWGSTSAVDIDKDGKTIWVAERCGANSCASSPAVDPILHFDENGKLIKSFGAGLVLFPHGIHVDRDGNVWVTDGQDNSAPPAGAGGARGRGATPAAGAPGGGGRAAAPPPPPLPPGSIGRGGPNAAATKGHQVFKFSPDGRLLLTLGKAGGGAPGAGTPEYFYQPNDVITNAAGEIFVSERHGNGGRILKFTKDGKFIKAWGEAGNGPGQFNIPHSLAFDSRGRLFVADRGNVRIQIFDQEGKFLDEMYQFSRLSGIYIDRNDMLYGADSESSPTSHPGGWRRGIRIGSVRDGKVQYFIPDPQHTTPQTSAPGGTSAAEGVAIDAAGNVYGAEVGPRAVKRYVKK